MVGGGLGGDLADKIGDAMAKKTIKDILNLQVEIEGVDHAEAEDKYIFIEDKHALGDMALLENEAQKTENSTTMATFIVIFIITAIAAAMCCYFNYTFHSELARAVFVMFIVAFFLEMLAFRNLLIFFMALFKYCKGKKDGYEYIEFKGRKVINDMLRLAVSNMFHHNPKNYQ